MWCGLGPVLVSCCIGNETGLNQKGNLARVQGHGNCNKQARQAVSGLRRLQNVTLCLYWGPGEGNGAPWLLWPGRGISVNATSQRPPPRRAKNFLSVCPGHSPNFTICPSFIYLPSLQEWINTLRLLSQQCQPTIKTLSSTGYRNSWKWAPLILPANVFGGSVLFVLSPYASLSFFVPLSLFLPHAHLSP